MTNGLDDMLLKSVKSAHSKYKKLTGGYGLWHAPESFVQMVMAQQIATTGKIFVYPECTPGGIERDASRIVRPGPRPKFRQQQRFDLVVWWKKDDRPRALVELKLTYASMDGIMKDAAKLLEYRKEAERHAGLRHGYLVAYNSAYRNINHGKERQGAKTIADRFENVTDKLKKEFALVDSYISREETFSEGYRHSYGVAVWRMNYENAD